MVVVALSTIGLYLSEVILCLRFWLMWNNDKRLIAATLATFLGTGAYFLYFGVSKVLVGTFVDSPSPGCAFVQAEQTVYSAAIIGFIYDVAISVLGVIPAVQMYRSQTYFIRGSIIKHVYHQGFQYYIFAVAWSAVSLFLSIQSPEGGLVMEPLSQVTRSIVATRMVLHIREVYQRNRDIVCEDLTGSRFQSSLD
ncbi:hypothetical protein P691DRAFT_460799 [Macrolepiota fuliginosa MF-IS2]|uniref:Uncharacterized protein n=1 Tax=Macrolepiota fuliginosa MF-IS2 TaxID=1400762 RepID=A0A9P5X1V4_9AGAR|nr:hypothetical protein P691DRAFT_460799 [Macrolepiota fuliginosa MF-IS2]